MSLRLEGVAGVKEVLPVVLALADNVALQVHSALRSLWNSISIDFFFLKMRFDAAAASRRQLQPGRVHRRCVPAAVPGPGAQHPPPGTTAISTILVASVEVEYRVLPSFTEFYPVLPSFT